MTVNFFETEFLLEKEHLQCLGQAYDSAKKKNKQKKQEILLVYHLEKQMQLLHPQLSISVYLYINIHTQIYIYIYSYVSVCKYADVQIPSASLHNF